jgi:hypothetical protein
VSYPAPRPPGTTARGYGAEHQRERDRWRVVVERGDAVCVRCSTWIVPGSSWDLDHTDERDGYLGAAHASCNRSAGATRGNALRAEVRGMTVRSWGRGGSDLDRLAPR